MISKFSISAISKASGAIAILGFVAVVAGSSWGLEELRVGGPIYTEIIKAKDVTADILPPPAYIIESFLEVTSAVMEPADLKSREKRLKVLHAEFDARQKHWLAQDLDPAVKSGLTFESRVHADAFWKLTEDRLLPALARGDNETAKTIYEDVKRAFGAHRAAIDAVVEDAAKWSAETESFAASRGWVIALSVWTLSALVAGIIIASVLGVSCAIVRPLVRLTGSIQDVAADKLDQHIPYTDNTTEIGAVANALSILRDGASERQRLELVARDRLQQDLQRQEALRTGVQKFLDTSSVVMAALQKQTAAMQSSAATLMAASTISSNEAAGAAKACVEASANSQAVAAATEELGASIREIAGQTHRTSAIVADATKSAAKTHQDVACFVDVAQRIGSIVETIRAIASQTDLLALNATIEAARSGDAGRGFAVVAQEVKALAAQTARATDEVGAQIDTMQNATRTTVEAVRAITHKVDEINQMTGAIAAAVEEQDSATQEIARRVSMTASGTETAAERSKAVSVTSERTKNEANFIADGAQELARVTKEIAAAVNEFIGVVGCDLDDRRTSLRHAANIEARLEIGNQEHAAVVRDLSATGAKLSKSVEIDPGTLMTLHMAGQAVSARSVWDADGQAGVTFENPLKVVEPILASAKPVAA